MRNGATVLDEMLDPISRCLNLQAAQSLLSLRVSKRTQARVDRLAEKCNEGQLTPKERSEYEAYVQASTLIGILQMKARRSLSKKSVA